MMSHESTHETKEDLRELKRIAEFVRTNEIAVPGIELGVPDGKVPEYYVRLLRTLPNERFHARNASQTILGFTTDLEITAAKIDSAGKRDDDPEIQLGPEKQHGFVRFVLSKVLDELDTAGIEIY